MTRGRLEAFSDGVFAIIITIMVLELAAPHDPSPSSLLPLVPKFLSYLLSFAFVGIYWNNHHHLLHTATRVDGRVLWANLHLLFWLSLFPFATGWMGENHFAAWPVAVYAGVQLLAAVAYYVLTVSLLALHGPASVLAVAVGRDLKGKVSVAIDLAAIPLAFVQPLLSVALLVAVALIWLAPDRRIERTLAD